MGNQWISLGEDDPSDSAGLKAVALLAQLSSEEVGDLQGASGLFAGGQKVIERYKSDRKDFMDESVPVLRKLVLTNQNNRLQHKINTMLPGQRSDLRAIIPSAYGDKNGPLITQMVLQRVTDTASYQTTVAASLQNGNNSPVLASLSLKQMQEIASLSEAQGDSNTALSLASLINERSATAQTMLGPIQQGLQDKGSLDDGLMSAITPEMLKDFIAVLQTKKELNKLKLDLALFKQKPSQTIKQISGWLNVVDDTRGAIVAYMDRKPVLQVDFFNSYGKVQEVYKQQQQTQQPPPPMQAPPPPVQAPPPPPPVQQQQNDWHQQQGNCVDNDPSCSQWSQQGECNRNQNFMNQKCCMSCQRSQNNRG